MPQALDQLPPLLLPRPRAVEMLPGRGSLIAAVAHEREQPGLAGPEAYSLHIDADGTRIAARSESGVRAARHTIAQLRRQYGDSPPSLRIDDAPAFSTRGVMLDISRDRVPTMGQLSETVDLLASLKFNHLQLYTEHTFAYAGHEEVWQGWSPMTPAETRDLDAYCRGRGVTLVANQNCFGHLARWLANPRYAPLAETHGDWVFENEHERFPHSGPFSLCPTDPRSIELIGDLLDQLLPCFASPLVNIGCDETFDVGQGRSKVEVERRGRAAVYFDFVHRIVGLARGRGKRPMFWADIALSQPESIPSIPEDMICLAWGYEPESPFAEWCSRLREAGREVWVCPGTSSWRSITGRTAERSANLCAAAVQGVANGASGYLVTDWGDSGHHQQWPVSLGAIAEGAERAWSGGGASWDPRAASLHAFNDASLAIGPWLEALGNVDSPLRAVSGRRSALEEPKRLRNSSFLFNDLFLPIGPGGEEKLRAGVLGVPTRSVQDVADRLRDFPAAPPIGATLTDELNHTLDVARVAARRALWRRRGTPAGDRPALRDQLASIIAEHRRLWVLRSREGGLADSVSYYDRVLKELA